MKFISGNDPLISELCRKMNLDPAQVISLDIHITANEPVYATVEYLVTTESMKTLLEFADRVQKWEGRN